VSAYRDKSQLHEFSYIDIKKLLEANKKSRLDSSIDRIKSNLDQLTKLNRDLRALLAKLAKTNK
jgi:superfamily II helicase